MASLKVSYSVINEAIMQLHNISSKPEEIYVAIGRLKSNFSISNSACAKELINAMDTYKEIYGLILGMLYKGRGRHFFNVLFVYDI